jgi:3-oxoadipate enol-lactonase
MTFSRIDGPADAPVLVLSNSLGTTLALWDPQMPALTEHFSVLRYDHPGHGLGSPRPVSSVEELGHGVLEILDGHGIGRVSFCGLSLGGAVGQWLAMHAPGRIDRLVLACGSARFGKPESWRARIETVRAGGVEAVADAVLAIWFTPETRRDSPELVRAYREMMVSAEREGYAGCCEALARWDPGDELAGIRSPTLVIAGSEDAATPPDQGAALQRRIPGARLSVLQGAGHLANLEQPDAFTRLLVDHLTAQPATEVA